MKYIQEHSLLPNLLQSWAGDQPLLIGSFWFWAAGTQLQRSLVGLYRTLLYQMLKVESSLCRIAFPEWYAHFSSSDPTLGMMTAAMARLLTYNNITYRFFFMIDGLDEYEGSSIWKANLADLILDFAKSSKIKLLLSSRPETPFQQRFGLSPLIRLETLTRSDILTYTKRRLAIGRLRSLGKTEEAECIVHDIHRDHHNGPDDDAITNQMTTDLIDLTNFIVEKADGVFLWVALALNTAIDGLDDHDDCHSIRDRLMLLPHEMTELFSHIITQRIPEHLRSEAYRYLLIASAWYRLPHHDGLSASIFVVAHQAFDYGKACTLANCYSMPQHRAAMKDLQGRLRNRCKGLLESEDSESWDSTIKCLHRSLYDYLRQDSVQKLLMSQLHDEFEVQSALMAGVVYELKRPQVDSIPAKWLVEAFYHLNAQAEIATGRHKAELITAWCELDTSDISRAVRAGSVLLVRETFRSSNGSASFGGSSKDWEVAHALGAAMPSCHGSEVRMNVSAASFLLIECGADPMSKAMRKSLYEETNSWQCALTGLAEVLDNTRRANATRPRGVTEALDLIALLAKHVQDREKCRTIEAHRQGSRSMTAPSIMRELILKRTCCSGAEVQHCYCLAAREWTSRALKVLQIIEEPVVDTSSPLPGAEEEWEFVTASSEM